MSTRPGNRANRSRAGWRAAVPLAAAALAAAACSSSVSTTAAQHGASSAPAHGATALSSPAASGTAVTLTAGTSKFGAVISAGGRAVYLFEKDAGTASACSGACVAAWPPVLTSGTPAAGTGIKAALLGTAKRSDGTTQVTYGGHLLYYFTGDTTAGDANGEGSQAFGGGWDLVSPAGQKVEKPGS